MTIIDLEDTVKFNRPPVGEDTVRIQLHDMPTIPRRPDVDETAERRDDIPRTLAVVDDETGALPVVGGEGGSSWTPPVWVSTPDYVGRHRRPVPLLVRALTWVGINLAGGAR